MKAAEAPSRTGQAALQSPVGNEKGLFPREASWNAPGSGLSPLLTALVLLRMMSYGNSACPGIRENAAARRIGRDHSLPFSRSRTNLFRQAGSVFRRSGRHTSPARG